MYMLSRLGAGISCVHRNIIIRTPRRGFYTGLDETRVHRLRRASTTFNKPRGRDTMSLAFERRVRVLPLVEVRDMYARPPLSSSAAPAGAEGRGQLNVLVVELLTRNAVHAPVPYPSAHPAFYADWMNESENKHESNERLLPSENQRQLQKNGDTSVLKNRSLTRKDNADASTTAVYTVALCIDPFLDVDQFRREEAQVEMICGYRNILYEAAELPNGPADIVRIPALSLDTCRPDFRHKIGKLNQQSLIKGFHRISNEAKETLIVNPHFSVELYVPPCMLDHFERAFIEDAWATPDSTLSPGRTAMYPGLPPPKTLLQLDGWIGGRRELIEAVETEGKSLMRGPQVALDGKVITPQEVFTDIRVYGRERELEEMLRRERETAAREGYDTDDNNNNNNNNK